MRFKPSEIATIIVAGIAFVSSVVSAFYTYANRSRELDIKLVEIGIGILRTDPKGAIAPARAWAIQVIEDNSKVTFNADDRKALLEKPLLLRPTAGASSAQDTTEITVPDKDLPQFLKNTESLGATVVRKTQAADGTWTIVVSYPRY